MIIGGNVRVRLRAGLVGSQLRRGRGRVPVVSVPQQRHLRQPTRRLPLPVSSRLRRSVHSDIHLPIYSSVHSSIHSFQVFIDYLIE